MTNRKRPKGDALTSVAKTTMADKLGSTGSALRGTEEPFRLLVESVIDYGIFMLDPEGRVASWNAGAERIKGYRANEIVGQHFSRFYTPADIESEKPARELIIATSEGRYEEEGWRVRKDGSWFWANVLITALRDENGRLRGFAKVTRDLTERREAESRLQSHQRLLAAVLQTVPVGLVVTDPEGRILLHNEAATRLWGEIGEGHDMMTQYRKTTAWWADTGQRLEPDGWPLWRALRAGETTLN